MGLERLKWWWVLTHHEPCMCMQHHILGKKVLVAVKFCHGKNLSRVADSHYLPVATYLAHSSEQPGMAKWLLWDMVKGGVNQLTFIGTCYVPGDELRIQKIIYCSLALVADRTLPYNRNRLTNSDYLT